MVCRILYYTIVTNGWTFRIAEKSHFTFSQSRRVCSKVYFSVQPQVARNQLFLFGYFFYYKQLKNEQLIWGWATHYFDHNWKVMCITVSSVQILSLKISQSRKPLSIKNKRITYLVVNGLLWKRHVPVARATFHDQLFLELLRSIVRPVNGQSPSSVEACYPCVAEELASDTSWGVLPLTGVAITKKYFHRF